jgi:hypothetical protein
MITSEELAEHAVLVAHEALDKLVEFARASGAADQTAIDASKFIVGKREVVNGKRDHRATWESFLANDLIMGTYEELREERDSSV